MSRKRLLSKTINYTRARTASFRVGGLERQTSNMSQLEGEYGGMFPRKILILTPLNAEKCI